jgi:diguanylate cyclase (GGDEF)-like protein
VALARAVGLVRFGAILLTIVAACDLLVVLRYSVVVGSLLIVCSTLFLLVARRLAKQGAVRAAAEAERQLRSASEGFLLDTETGLPNRQHLIDQLAREIARAQRYAQEMTLSVIEVSRLRDLETAWGAATRANAVKHVAETLRRVTRTSDFLARIDDAHFAVLLTQCNATQAASFGERVSLAVSNRPLRSTSTVRVPLYVSVELTATEFQATRFRGPLDFLSAAGGDLQPAPEPRRPALSGAPANAPRRSLAADPQALRRQLVRDYYPEGKAQDFAYAYRAQRGRRAI